MKFIKKLLVPLGIFYIVIYSCIPIEDVVPPQIDSFTLQEDAIYYYQDTLSFDVVYRDNALLDSGIIRVKKSETELSTPNDWDTIISLELVGRRLERGFSIRVPEFKTPGRYNVELVIFDQGKNSTSSTRSFLLEQDNTNPVFNGLKIDLEQGRDGTFQACRSEIIGIEGGVSDNLSVSRIGFQLSSGQNDAVAVSADSLAVGSFFGSSVVVPSNVPNGELLTLTVFAIDTFQNRVEQDFIINVACDDEPPQITIAQTSPSLNANSFANVAQGTRFSIDSLVISDNEYLSTARVFFNTQGEPLTELYNRELNTSNPVDLSDSVNLVFEIPDDAAIGLTREITIVATDSSGNRTPNPTVITFSVIEDVAPVILITNTYINRVETSWSTTDTTPLSIGDEINFDGKVEELNRLSNLTVFWGEESNPTAVINLKEFSSLPLNLSSIQDTRTFRVPNNAEPDSIFLLRIVATDSRNQSTEVSYRFRIEQ